MKGKVVSFGWLHVPAKVSVLLRLATKPDEHTWRVGLGGSGIYVAMGYTASVQHKMAGMNEFFNKLPVPEVPAVPAGARGVNESDFVSSTQNTHPALSPSAPPPPPVNWPYAADYTTSWRPSLAGNRLEMTSPLLPFSANFPARLVPLTSVNLTCDLQSSVTASVSFLRPLQLFELLQDHSPTLKSFTVDREVLSLGSSLQATVNGTRVLSWLLAAAPVSGEIELLENTPTFTFDVRLTGESVPTLQSLLPELVTLQTNATTRMDGRADVSLSPSDNPNLLSALAGTHLEADFSIGSEAKRMWANISAQADGKMAYASFAADVHEVSPGKTQVHAEVTADVPGLDRFGGNASIAYGSPFPIVGHLTAHFGSLLVHL